ncbi:pilus assembly PilX N-terminal domain-containing protein [Planctomycetota bacterium]
MIIYKRRYHAQRGVTLSLIVGIMTLFTMIGIGVLSLADSEVTVTRREVDAIKAFYLAEAGIAELTAQLNANNFNDISDTLLGAGRYGVTIVNDSSGFHAISTGQVGNATKRIRVEASFLAGLYEQGIFAGNGSNQPFYFSLRGKGTPMLLSGGREQGGADLVEGDIYVNGDVRLYEESKVQPSPGNTYQGDVAATGTIETDPSAAIAGNQATGAGLQENPDLVAMNYSSSQYNVGQAFADADMDWGRLPESSDFHDIVVKNPTGRSSECEATEGDDYFFEPAAISGSGSYRDAPTPLDLGEDRVYYVDGNVWIHSKYTYGFNIDGKATIVATGNIHICDNIGYADNESLLGLVALGNYDEDGQLKSGGNIYFGDPRYGTTYSVDALMFAADSFLYNTDAVTRTTAEPETGFKVFGNFAALNQVSVRRDWYGPSTNRRPAYYDPVTYKWIDYDSGHDLTTAEIGTLTHYQMEVAYDERVRKQDTQPPGLPRGTGSIFAGLINWQEI